MKELRVSLRFTPDDVRPVGTLVEDGRRLWFEFAADPPNVSPYALPLDRGALVEHRPKPGVPNPGVFADAQPDGWGLKLLHRAFQRAGRPPSSVSALDELAYLGDRTMGALTFEPATGPEGSFAESGLRRRSHRGAARAGPSRRVLGRRPPQGPDRPPS